MLKSKAKKIFLTIIVICLLILIVTKGVSIIKNGSYPKPFFTFVDLVIPSEPDNYTEIYGHHTVGQVYVPKYADLCRIGFFILKEKEEEKEKEGTLIFHLKHSIDAEDDILRLIVKSSELYNNYYAFKLPPLVTPRGSFYFFEFKPLSNIVGKPLYFYLESPDCNQPNAIKVGYWKNIFRRGNAGGPSYRDGVVWDGYLAFESYYGWDGNLYTVAKVIFKRLIRDRSFAIFHSFLCLSLLAGIIAVNYKLSLLKQ